MSNKFRQIIDAKRQETPEAEDEAVAPAPPEATPPAPASPSARSRRAPALEAAPARRGRPPKPEGAKRSNPDYEQVTAYIRKQTYKRVKIRLIEQEQEFSELVEELLTTWLKQSR